MSIFQVTVPIFLPPKLVSTGDPKIYKNYPQVIYSVNPSVLHEDNVLHVVTPD